MNWTTAKAEIVALLGARTFNSINYAEVTYSKEDPLEWDASHVDNFYSLKAIGVGEIESHVGNKWIGYTVVELMLKYGHDAGTTERVTSFDEFWAIISAILALSSFSNFFEDPTFVDIDDKHAVGTFKFTYGENTLC